MAVPCATLLLDFNVPQKSRATIARAKAYACSHNRDDASSALPNRRK
jgi:hypothetical protein